MTLTEMGRRVAERPAFPGHPSWPDGDGDGGRLRGDRGMTIHEHATLELMKYYIDFMAQWCDGPQDHWTASAKARCKDWPLMGQSLEAADAYCNALGAREAGK